MTSLRLPRVKAQRSFLSGIRPSREHHGQSESNSATYKKIRSSELKGFYHSIFDFLASYRVSKYKKPREITNEIINKRKWTAFKKKP
jgi:hypothetical protein